MKTTAQIIEGIAASIAARNSPHLAAERIGQVQALLDRVLPEYSAVLGLTPDAVLAAIEAHRDIAPVSYYQEGNFPKLDGVTVFESPEAFRAAAPSGKFICPACEGHSTDPYTCNTGIVRNGKPCDWKSWGLFGTAGKGLRAVVKSTFLDAPKVHEIFMPVELAAADLATHEGRLRVIRDSGDTALIEAVRVGQVSIADAVMRVTTAQGKPCEL